MQKLIKLTRSAAIVLIVIAAGLFGWYWLANLTKKPLTAEQRKTIPGQFISLTRGVVHYELAGPEQGAVVVLVHGFSLPMTIWDNTVNDLADAGFRTLRYDLYGRGYSDRPGVDHTLALYEEQLVQLIEALSLKTPLSLVGLSMGGGIVTAFAAKQPDSIASLCLLAPIGYPLEKTMSSQIIMAPLVGDYLIGVIGDMALTGYMKSSFFLPEAIPAFESRFIEQLHYNGYHQAIVSSMRHVLYQDLDAYFKAVGQANIPVLLCWGDKDQVIPFNNHLLVQQAIPALEFRPVAGGGHNAHFEMPEVVNPLLIDFLLRH